MDTFVSQPMGEIGVVARPLAANSDVFSLRFASGNRLFEQHFDRWVAFIKVGRQQFQT